MVTTSKIPFITAIPQVTNGRNILPDTFTKAKKRQKMLRTSMKMDENGCKIDEKGSFLVATDLPNTVLRPERSYELQQAIKMVLYHMPM